MKQEEWYLEWRHEIVFGQWIISALWRFSLFLKLVARRMKWRQFRASRTTLVATTIVLSKQFIWIIHLRNSFEIYWSLEWTSILFINNSFGRSLARAGERLLPERKLICKSDCVCNKRQAGVKTNVLHRWSYDNPLLLLPLHERFWIKKVSINENVVKVNSA